MQPIYNINPVGYSIEVERDGDNRKFSLSIYIDSDPTNCKLSYIHGIGELYAYTKDEKKITKIIEDILSKLKGSVIINTINKGMADVISKNFDTYYYQQVPIGYGNGYQYHICIRNNKNINRNCRKPEDNTDLIKREVTNSNFDYNKLSEELIKKLKEKRRKTDFVEDLINELRESK